MEYNCFCSNCNTGLHRKPSYLKRYNKVYCNKECQNQEHVKLSTAITVKCSYCSKEIQRTNNALRKSKTGIYFCNNACKNIYISQKCRWDGDPYDYRGRRKKVFEAANNSCQQCGDNEDIRMLDVHHANGNHHDNAWINLRCLCVWCHQKHHRCEMVLNLPCLFDKDGNRQSVA